MTLVVITLHDEDDSVNIRLESEPPIPTTTDELTEAQITALQMLDAVATPEDVVNVEGS